MKKCPRCGNTEFYVEVKTEEIWLVDGEGSLISVTDGCSYVEEFNPNDFWECSECGFEGYGDDFQD